jgi:hypothetical protein
MVTIVVVVIFFVVVVVVIVDQAGELNPIGPRKQFGILDIWRIHPDLIML